MTRKILLAAAVLCLGLVSAHADEYLVYTDAGIPGNGTDVWVWCENSASIPCDFSEAIGCAVPEGSRYFRQRGTVDWQGFGIFHNIDPGPDGLPATGDEFPTPVDLSHYLGGELRFRVRTTIDLTIEMQCDVGGSEKGASYPLSSTSWDGTDTWQSVSIPLADFAFGAGPPVDLATCLQGVLSPFMATGANLGTGFHSFEIDHVRWHKGATHAGASTVQVSGRQLTVNGEPFVVRGVSYTPISVGEDWRGALRDRPDRYLVDFPLIAASGANTVRIYSTYMTTAMLDAAAAAGLFVVPTFPVDTNQLLCAQGKAFMTDRFRDAVLEWKDHPAILFWLVGNEININPGSADLCADWYPQLDAMAAAAHAAEGANFHPVGTANADTGLADVCQPGCSDDTALPNVDLWGIQLYRGCTFGDAFDRYAAKADCSRPLVVTEFGADSWDSLSGASGAENQAMQAECLTSLLGEAEQALALRDPLGVSSGQVVFSWADEWWKAFPLPGEPAGFCSTADNTQWTTQDTCKSWESLGYPDPAMNEEWWGIVSVDPAAPDSRGLRQAHTALGEQWNLGNACNLQVTSHDPGTGLTGLSFDPAPASTNHTLYYGPLSAVSTYGYSGSVTDLGTTGSSNVTLPTDTDLFWLVVGQDGSGEGGYGNGLAIGGGSSERPASPGASLPQDANRTGLCSTP